MFYKLRSVTKVKITRSKFSAEMGRSCHNEHLCKMSKTYYLPIKKYGKVTVFNKYVKHQGQGQICWYPWKGLVTRSTHVTYQSPSTYHPNVVAKVKVLISKSNTQGQGHKVNNFGTYEKMLSQGTLM